MSLVAITIASVAHGQALPFLAPGDPALRHQIELEADDGQIPLSTTWPIPSADIPVDERATLRGYNQPGSAADAGWFTTMASNPTKLRYFTDTARDNSAGVQSGWAAGDYAGGAIRMAYNIDPPDGMHYRFDGSYAAWRYGNWWVTVGQQDRWWGPGWDSSLILSTNARPMPGIGLERVSSKEESWKGFRWLGPWHLVTFVDHMENHRLDFNNTLFWGGRFTFEPAKGVEIGLSRTAELCGRGHSCGLGTFWDALLAKSNRTVNPIVDQNPGDTSLLAKKESAQLMATDVRWHIGRSPFAVYWQQMAEVFDDGNLRPRQTTELLGAEFASKQIMDGRLRLFLEMSDTTCGDLSFSKTDHPNYGCAYEKDTWREGYRYYATSIGDSMDRDGLRFTLGGMYADAASRQWDLRLRHFNLNRGGIAEAGLLADPVTTTAEQVWNVNFDLAGNWGQVGYAFSLGTDYANTTPQRKRFAENFQVNINRRW